MSSRRLRLLIACKKALGGLDSFSCKSNSFSYETFSRGLVLKQRHKVTWKSLFLLYTLFCCAKQTKMFLTYRGFSFVLEIYIRNIHREATTKSTSPKKLSKFEHFYLKRILMHKSTCLFPWRLQYCVFCHLFLSFFFDDFYKILTLQKELQDLGFETSDQNVLVEYKGKEAMFWSNVKWI